MNRVIKRLAAYIDDNGNLNETINQATSEKNVDDTIDSAIVLYLASSTELSLFQSAYRYESLSSNYKQKDNKYIGLCGNTIEKGNDQYVIEWHVYKLKETSIIEALQRLYEFCEDNSYSQYQEQQLNTELDKDIEEKYYFTILFCYKNGIQIYCKKQYYNKFNTINQLKQIGKLKISQYIKML